MVINNFLFFLNIKTSLLTPECRFQHSRHIKHTQYIYPLLFSGIQLSHSQIGSVNIVIIHNNIAVIVLNRRNKDTDRLIII